MLAGLVRNDNLDAFWLNLKEYIRKKNKNFAKVKNRRLKN